MNILLLLLSLASNAFSQGGYISNSGGTNGSFITPTITSPTVVGSITGPAVFSESAFDPDVHANKIVIGQLSTAEADGDGLCIVQAAAGDTYCLKTNANGFLYESIGDLSSANSLAQFRYVNGSGDVMQGGRAAETSGTLTVLGSDSVGVNDVTPEYTFEVTAKDGDGPTTFIIAGSSQSGAAVFGVNTNGDAYIRGATHMTSSLTVVGKVFTQDTVGLNDSTPSGQLGIKALASHRPLDDVLHISSQNETAIMRMNTNGTLIIGQTGTTNGVLESNGSLINNIDADSDATDRSWSVWTNQSGNVASGTRLIEVDEAGVARIPGRLSVEGTLTTNSTFTAVGVTDASNAAAGKVGEVMSGVLSGAFTPINDAFVSIATITLTAGDWDVYGMCAGAIGGTTASTERYCGISLTANTAESGLYTAVDASVPSVSVNNHLVPMVRRVNVSGSTPVYVVARIKASVIGGFTWSVNSNIYARRVR